MVRLADRYGAEKVEVAYGMFLLLPSSNSPTSNVYPQLIYMIARISMLMHIFAITINRNALAEVPCSDLTFMSKCACILHVPLFRLENGIG